MQVFHPYLCVVLTVLTVWILGCLNPTVFQTKKNGKSTGYPSYLWAGFWGLVVGVLAVYFMSAKGRNTTF